LGGYWRMNIVASIGIGSLRRKPYQPNIGIRWDNFKNFDTNLVVVLGSKADFWLVCDRYILDIEINITLVLNFYYIRSMLGRYGYLPQVIPIWLVLLIPEPISIYVPRFQLGSCPRLVLNSY
jgi:hypothetical protein